MSFRTNATAVEALLGGAWDGLTDVTPYIETANNLVTDVCTDVDYTDAKLELIERWLSADCYLVSYRRVISEKTGDASGTFEGGTAKNPVGFESTGFGQRAMLIDTAGGLARLNAAVKSGKLFKGYGVLGMNIPWTKRWQGYCYGWGWVG